MKLEKVAGNIAKVDEKYYIVEEGEEGGYELRPINWKEFEKKLDEIVKKLIGSMNSEVILRDALTEMGKDEIEQLYLRLCKSKRKPIIKQSKGCVELKVGKFIIPIR